MIPTTPLLVVCHLPDPALAEQLATTLVERRLAASVNILAPCQSVYRWQGRVERAQEIPVLINTTEACYPALEAVIQAAHPYDVPQIVALPLAHGLPAYLQWLCTESGTP